MGKDLGQKDEKIVLLEVCKIEGKVLLIHILLAVVQKCSSKEVFLKISQNSQENMFQSLFFFKLQAEVSNVVKKETLFSCEFCKIL